MGGRSALDITSEITTPPHEPASDVRWGTLRRGRIELDGPVVWSEGTRVEVRRAPHEAGGPDESAYGIIGGFGLAGRCVAELLDRHGIAYTIVEKNLRTVATQLKLGRSIIAGDASDEALLRQAGLLRATLLALTMPDEAAVIRATEIGRSVNAALYILARTNFASQGLKALAAGADDVVKAEEAVAMHFFHRVARRLDTPQTVPR